nr:MDIS1-interacting receptor like kinase 2-like [Tanacetum cinerariifolium]
MMGYNNISGSIPPKFENSIQVLDLSSNNLVGQIPKEFGQMKSMLNLNSSDNNLSNVIPQELGSLHDLLALDLSKNRVDIDMSYNELTGPVPPYGVFLNMSGEALQGNSGILIAYRRRKRASPPEPSGEEGGKFFSIISFDAQAMHDEIIKVINDFDDAYCIGTGGYGQTLPVSKLGCVLCHDAAAFCLRRPPAFCLKVTAFWFKTKLRFVSRPSAFCSRTHWDLSQDDTRPPMLDRTDFASWQQSIRLYCRGKDNGVNILKSIDEGPYKLGTFRETLAESTEGTPQFGPERPHVYSDLNSKERDWYNADIRATNILLQGLLKDIYTLINHYTDAKDIWDNVKMLLEGSELTKEDRESQLYNDFEHFRQHKEESINDYYVRFSKLINDMRNIKMTMPKLQLNSKFVNNMLPEWGRFVTAVKLNRGLRESNYDQLFAVGTSLSTHSSARSRSSSIVVKCI